MSSWSSACHGQVVAGQRDGSIVEVMEERATADRMADARERIRSLWSYRGRYRVLHLTWFAFFLTFVVWFNLAPFAATIGDQLGLSKGELVTLALCNVALTVPARVFVGMALDRFGPRRVYAAILLYAAVPSLCFAVARSFPALVASRLALSVVGAGFVVGIRMVSEWFPPREVGTAEGVYGGWGNFGAGFATLGLPIAAALLGGGDAWRWVCAATGLLSACYGLFYLRAVEDTPPGVAYVRPRRQGALEVTGRGAVHGLALLTAPLSLALVVIVWRIHDTGVLALPAAAVALALVTGLLVYQTVQVYRVNRPALRDAYPPEDRYPFRSVAVLSFAYFCSFGSELAIASMLPEYFADTYGLGPVAAGVAAAGYTFLNFLFRPAGGLLSDLLGSRRRTLRALLVGIAVGGAAMALLGPAWPLALAVLVATGSSFFAQASNGAVYAVAPLVKKRVSGQIAGLVGAYGNVGAIAFLTLLLWVEPSTFFLVIALCSLATALAASWLVEPGHSFSAELLTDAGAGERVAERMPA